MRDSMDRSPAARRQRLGSRSSRVALTCEALERRELRKGTLTGSQVVEAKMQSVLPYLIDVPDVGGAILDAGGDGGTGPGGFGGLIRVPYR